MTKPQDLANSVNAGSIPASRLQAGSVTNTQVSASAGISATKLSYALQTPAAVSRTVAARVSDYVNARDFGAVGDGVTDNTAFLQAGLDYCIGAGKTLFIPDGVYKILGGLVIYDGTGIAGAGNSTSATSVETFTGTKLLFSGSGSACIRGFNTSGIFNKFITIRDLIIYANGQYSWMIDIFSALGISIENVTAWTDWTGGGGLRSGTQGDGASIPSWVNRLTDVSIGLPDASTGHTADVWWTDSMVVNGYFTGGRGFIDRGFGGNRYANCQFDRTNSSGAGLTLKKRPNSTGRDKQISICGCYFDVNLVGVQVDATGFAGRTEHQVNIVGCTFRNSFGVDIKLLGDPSYVSTGVNVCASSMSEFANKSFEVIGRWEELNIIGNSFVKAADAITSDNAPVSTVVDSANGSSMISGVSVRGSKTIHGKSAVSGIFGSSITSTSSNVLLGSDNGNQPFVAAGRSSLGTASPLSLITDNLTRFQVKSSGSVRAIPLSSAPASPEAGEIYFDSSLEKLRCWDGTVWNNLF
jgi:hypothetical protein